MAQKEVVKQIKLQIPAGKANPSPPVGPALGQAGVNIMEFCKAFNAKTQDMKAGMPIPVIISVYSDRSFTFICKSPPASFLLLEAAKLKKGASKVGVDVVGSVTVEQIKEIVKIKKNDLNAGSEEAAIKIIAGSATSMGIEVKE